ncbi:MAG: hydroxymethylglutaryl-CoA lyase [Chitinophagaceae bacterium]|jgi:hydroxymethylglutaryl-CoA lyase|nr:hydroxymethylglutaryl-CoA lyase [Chitinophagaceae bacterium]MBK9938065.1 hydroxymethylglutaryl-CoA lyase [Chitinophagaceae bacterium]MBL0067998.1 hydroxymethylglutaryl-CoA lyase [Chitinophagaceae bacterium]MBP6233113.1 hydroxymethylglutaryl-CoA lyase [Chitinophagaceae bacterium]MBP6415567.1 hydroxymethylglutaryl-CoA lyase [Chitinophagaceae bacterium]
MNFAGNIKLIECPRDAMQGWKRIIPAEKKIAYINSLLKVGFDTIDFGSFVSPKAIPQMADTSEVVRSLELGVGSTKLLAIIANMRGAEEASVFDEITYLGFPFSVSETFQQRNTNSTIEQSLGRVEDIQNLCVKTGKELVVYISMGFGNPYGDAYDEEIVFEWVNKLVAMDIGIISLADTVGLASAEQVYDMTSYLVDSLPGTEIGVHLHSTPENWKSKLEAAVKAGCTRFDGALKGIGGCPMADDELVGNMNSELMIDYFEQQGLLPGLNKEALLESLRIAGEIFI